MLHFILLLLGFGAVSFVQNMAFTWSSRSRNSGDPNYHRKASWCSNGIYYITNALLTIYIIKTQLWWMLAIQGLVYTITTAEGSVLMMRRLIAKEKGKRAVGGGNAVFTVAEGDMIRQRALFVDTGDGTGTFTSAELAALKELVGTKLETVDEIVTESIPREQKQKPTSATAWGQLSTSTFPSTPRS
jgi:hypothetical protein